MENIVSSVSSRQTNETKVAINRWSLVNCGRSEIKEVSKRPSQKKLQGPLYTDVKVSSVLRRIEWAEMAVRHNGVRRTQSLEPIGISSSSVKRPFAVQWTSHL